MVSKMYGKYYNYVYMKLRSKYRPIICNVIYIQSRLAGDIIHLLFKLSITLGNDQ